MFNTFGVQCFINSVFILFSPAHRVSRVKQKTKTNLALVLTSKDFCLSCDIIAGYNIGYFRSEKFSTFREHIAAL